MFSTVKSVSGKP